MKVSKRRSLTKAFTWRFVGTVDTFVLSFIITRKLAFALAISGVELVTKIVLYYFHERAWNKVRWGRI